jgi:hypothetical protein
LAFDKMMSMNPVPVRPLGYATAFDECLDPGERVLWAGQPRQGIFLRSSDWGLIPFSLMWGGFAIFWETTAVSSMWRGKGVPLMFSIFFPLFGVPFVLVGLYFIFGRFFVDAWLRRRIWYGITDRRALIIITGSNRKVTSFDLRSIGEVNFLQHSDGSGSLVFGPTVVQYRRRAWNSGMTQANAFDHIPDATRAYHIVRQVQQSLLAPAAPSPLPPSIQA